MVGLCAPAEFGGGVGAWGLGITRTHAFLRHNLRRAARAGCVPGGSHYSCCRHTRQLNLLLGHSQQPPALLLARSACDDKLWQPSL